MIRNIKSPPMHTEITTPRVSETIDIVDIHSDGLYMIVCTFTYLHVHVFTFVTFCSIRRFENFDVYGPVLKDRIFKYSTKEAK